MATSSRVGPRGHCRSIVQLTGQTIASFADSQLTDALKHLAADPGTDHKVKKKLAAVLAGWRRQFHDDPSMALVAKLYDQCKIAQTDRANADKRAVENVNAGMGLDVDYIMERKKKEEEARKKKEEEKRKAKEEKEKRKREEEERRRKASQPKTKRKPFNFEQVRREPLSIFYYSQCYRRSPRS